MMHDEIKSIQAEIRFNRYVSIFCAVVMLASAVILLLTLTR